VVSIAMNSEPSHQRDRNEDDDVPEPSPGIVREFLQFLRRDIIWWLLAIAVLLAVVGVVIVLSANNREPFIYQDH
jgi:hypothetical protein